MTITALVFKLRADSLERLDHDYKNCRVLDKCFAIEAWRAVLENLVKRGLKRPELIPTIFGRPYSREVEVAMPSDLHGRVNGPFKLPA